MIPLNLAIVGATGSVGRQLLEVLEERDFPVKSLRLFASDRSVGDFIDFNEKPYPVQSLDKDSFSGVDVVFFCAPRDICASYLPLAKIAGALCVDTALPWIDGQAILSVPEINGDNLNRAKQRILSNPASITTMIALPLSVLSSCRQLKRIVVTSFESVSGEGVKAVDGLRTQCGELLNGRPAKNGCFPHQMAFNCLPQVGLFRDGQETDHEQQVQHELIHLLGDTHLDVALTCVRVPVFYGDCASIYIEFDQPVDMASLEQALSTAPGIEWLNDPQQGEYPMPVDSAGTDDVQVGRLRFVNKSGSAVQMFVAMDNLRKGAALNMVQMVERAWEN
nr:aspartate-semialdehyde dehydrogenase [uncultured Desulfuromonas sp.]